MSYESFLVLLMVSAAARDHVFADGMMDRERRQEGAEEDNMRVDGIRFECIACGSLIP